MNSLKTDSPIDIKHGSIVQNDIHHKAESAILNFTSRPTSDNNGSVTSEVGMVENVGVAVGISSLRRLQPEIYGGR